MGISTRALFTFANVLLWWLWRPHFACGQDRSISDLDPVLVPLVLPIMEYVATQPAKEKRFYSVELMAGHKAITLAMHQKGYAAFAYDKEYFPGNEHNILSSEGFLRGLDALLPLACSSIPWIFL